MTKFFSKTTGGFYDTDINEVMPSDAVEVSDAAYNALFIAQESGQVITSDEAGNPIATLGSAPTSTSRAILLLSQGIALTSASLPAVNGTYTISSNAQNAIMGIMLSILATQKFPGGAAQYAYMDDSGAPHMFTMVVFQEFAAAYASYVGNLTQFIDSNGVVGTLPTSNQVAIP